MRDKAGFSGKNVLPSELERWTKDGSKNILNSLKDLVISFYWVCSVKKIYIIWCVSAHMWENFCSCFWPRIFSANKIGGFFNQPHLQNKSVMDFRGIQFDYIQFQSKIEMGQILKPTKSLRTEAVVRKCSVKKSVFKNSAKLLRKHLCRALFFNCNFI